MHPEALSIKFIRMVDTPPIPATFNPTITRAGELVELDRRTHPVAARRGAIPHAVGLFVIGLTDAISAGAAVLIAHVTAAALGCHDFCVLAHSVTTVCAIRRAVATRAYPTEIAETLIVPGCGVQNRTIRADTVAAHRTIRSTQGWRFGHATDTVTAPFAIGGAVLSSLIIGAHTVTTVGQSTVGGALKRRLGGGAEVVATGVAAQTELTVTVLRTRRTRLSADGVRQHAIVVERPGAHTVPTAQTRGVVLAPDAASEGKARIDVAVLAAGVIPDAVFIGSAETISAVEAFLTTVSDTIEWILPITAHSIAAAVPPAQIPPIRSSLGFLAHPIATAVLTDSSVTERRTVSVGLHAECFNVVTSALQVLLIGWVRLCRLPVKERRPIETADSLAVSAKAVEGLRAVWRAVEPALPIGAHAVAADTVHRAVAGALPR
jgi:hypothetical protein